METHRNPSDIIQRLYQDRKVRAAVAKADISYFASLYMSRHINYEMAPMHKEILGFAQDPSLRYTAIMAARGLGKSTLMSLIYPIWAVIGAQQKKFVVIVSQTQGQARQMFDNIRREFEGNDLLRGELGPFESTKDPWGNDGIVLSRYGAKIIAVSVDQSVRGIKHEAQRPDLVILDDIEDVQAVRSFESREKTYKWFTSEVYPLGDVTTKYVLVGNKLHEESLMMRIADSIKEKKRPGVTREYPLVDSKGRAAWPDKFRDQASIKKLQDEVGDEVAYRREYLLEVIDNAEPVVKKEWINYYDELPGEAYKHSFVMSATGVDVAIAEHSRADFTAMVSAHVYKIEGKLKIYILPNPVNERIGSPAQAERAKLVSRSVGDGSLTPLYIEDVGYQASLIQHLQLDGYPASGYKPHGQDKRARLALAAILLQKGSVLFPTIGCEDLIRQVLTFPTAKHDDLVDAMVILILKVIEEAENQGPSIYIDHNGGFWGPRGMGGSSGRSGRRSIANMSDDEFFSRESGITIR